jgi:hypothetical protein
VSLVDATAGGGDRGRHHRQGGFVKDAQGDSAYGRTDWRRFAVAVGVPTVVAGLLVVGLAHGAFAASLTLSGQAFKIKADTLDATGFVQYSQNFDQAGPNADKPLGLAVAGIRDAKLYNLCQSVHPKGAPFSLVIHAGRGKDNPALAHNMLIGMTHLSGETVFKGIEIGKDASTVTKGSDDGTAKGDTGGFAQEANSVIITNLEQTAQYTAAGEFTLTGLDLSVDTDWDGHPAECF